VLGAGRVAGFLLAATLLVLCLFWTGSLGAALAQPTNPLSPGLPQQSSSIPTTTTAPAITPTQTTSTAGGGGLSGGSALVIAIGAVVILAGISFYIWRDARRRAPTRARSAAVSAGDVPGGRAGSKSRAKPRKLSPAERRRRKRGRAR
jgi:hypothetical protein